MMAMVKDGLWRWNVLRAIDIRAYNSFDALENVDIVQISQLNVCKWGLVTLRKMLLRLTRRDFLHLARDTNKLTSSLQQNVHSNTAYLTHHQSDTPSLLQHRRKHAHQQRESRPKPSAFANLKTSSRYHRHRHHRHTHQPLPDLHPPRKKCQAPSKAPSAKKP